MNLGKVITFSLLLSFAVIFASGCGLMDTATIKLKGGKSTGTVTDPNSLVTNEQRNLFRQQALGILQSKCVSCHGTSGMGNISNISSETALVQQSLLVPGDVASSRLYQSISAKRMPPTTPLSSDEVETISRYIKYSFSKAPEPSQSPSPSPSASPVPSASPSPSPSGGGTTNTCGVNPSTGRQYPTYDNNVGPILTRYCTACHTDYLSTYAQISANEKLGSKGISDSIGQIESLKMPPSGLPKPTASEIQVLKDWKLANMPEKSINCPTPSPSPSPSASPTPSVTPSPSPVPSTTPSPSPSVNRFALRVHAGYVSTTVTDSRNLSFLVDQNFNLSTAQKGAGYHAHFDPKNITNESDLTLFRWGRDSTYAPYLEYDFSVPNGSYTVVLYFYDHVNHLPGDRVFDITLNGAKVYDSFDIIAAAGDGNAILKSFDVTVNNGKLNIRLLPIKGNSMINAFEIFPKGFPLTPTNGTAPVPTVTPSPTPMPSATPTPTPTPSPSPSPMPSVSPSPSPSPTPSPTPVQSPPPVVPGSGTVGIRNFRELAQALSVATAVPTLAYPDVKRAFDSLRDYVNTDGRVDSLSAPVLVRSLELVASFCEQTVQTPNQVQIKRLYGDFNYNQGTTTVDRTQIDTLARRVFAVMLPTHKVTEEEITILVDTLDEGVKNGTNTSAIGTFQMMRMACIIVGSQLLKLE